MGRERNDVGEKSIKPVEDALITRNELSLEIPAM